MTLMIAEALFLEGRELLVKGNLDGNNTKTLPIKTMIKIH